MTAPIKQALSKAMSAALEKALSVEIPQEEIELSFEIPREEKFGDISSNIILRVAKEHKKSPRVLAQEVESHLGPLLKSGDLKGRIAKTAVEGPGFINFYYSAQEIAEVISKIRKEGADFGRPRGGPKKNILLEFVSANPTGPLTVAHGRQAALGDSLARILSFCGHKVTKEYYNNDEGVQIETLGKSAHLWLRKELYGENPEFPENFYRGQYLEATAANLIRLKGEALKKMDAERQIEACRDFAKEDILKGIKKDLEDFGVRFDHFYSQEKLGKSGKVEKTLEALKKKEVVYEKDGALWFRSTDFGDDKDRVLIKSDKSYTYLTPDIAYHEEKFQRGFDTLINIWGPDHHGYIARLKASQTALGHDPARIHILIAQLVTLYEGEKQVRMSTRAGEFVTLREILDEVGKDAGRFFFLMRKFDAHLDFDLVLAKSQTQDNPVFYIQYAHARIESLKGLCLEKGVSISWKDMSCVSRLSESSEIQLMRHLSAYENTLSGAERTLEPYRLVEYLKDLAASFHRFYTDHRVVTEDASLTQGRLMLSVSTQAVLRSGLELLGVSAPLKM